MTMAIFNLDKILEKIKKKKKQTFTAGQYINDIKYLCQN